MRYRDRPLRLVAIGNLSLPPQRRDRALSRLRVAYDYDQVANRFRELWIEPIDEAEGPA